MANNTIARLVIIAEVCKICQVKVAEVWAGWASCHLITSILSFYIHSNVLHLKIHTFDD